MSLTALSVPGKDKADPAADERDRIALSFSGAQSGSSDLPAILRLSSQHRYGFMGI